MWSTEKGGSPIRLYPSRERESKNFTLKVQKLYGHQMRSISPRNDNKSKTRHETPHRHYYNKSHVH